MHTHLTSFTSFSVNVGQPLMPQVAINALIEYFNWHSRQLRRQSWVAVACDGVMNSTFHQDACHSADLLRLQRK